VVSLRAYFPGTDRQDGVRSNPLLLLEIRIGFWAAVTAIGVDVLQFGALFQVGQRFSQ